MKSKLLLAVLLLIVSHYAVSQDRPTAKFGKVTAADFAPQLYSVDSSADAVVIADIASTEIIDNSKGSFALQFKWYRRARIINKNGYDLGDVSIPLYTNESGEEELNSLKAVTYNLENGKVVQTKLDTRSGVFKDKKSKNWVVKKFTFPNVKEGSIIEYEFKINSDFIFNLQPWDFQGGYPRLWSQYTVSMPEFYYYVTLAQGYHPFFIKDQKNRIANFSLSDTRGAGASDHASFSAGVTDYTWAMKDVPALKEESFTSTLDNHIARIQFQMAEHRYPLQPRNIMGSWSQACETLLKDEDFGYQLDRDNGWMNDVIENVTGKNDSEMEKARNIFTYLRDNITCTNHNRLYLQQGLKNVLKNKNGSEAEVNLLLTAMLRKAGLSADPVILSTKSHGYVYAMYPLLDRFNYVICAVNIQNKTYYLDASEPRMAFGKLGYDCYNGQARIVNTEATPVSFEPDSLYERELTSVFVIEDAKGNFSGSVQRSPGYYESLSIRDEIKDKGLEQFTEKIRKSFPVDTKIQAAVVDSLNRYDEPLLVKYEFEIKSEGEDILYFNPMLGEGFKENPFKSASRQYPVEMPYAIDQNYLLQLTVPQGYVVDELPKQIIVKLNEENDGSFEYRISQSNGSISLRSRLRLKRANYLPEEYESLREFFNLVVKKHNEQIVFKKQK